MSVIHVICASPDKASDTKFGHLVQKCVPYHSAEKQWFNFYLLVCYEQKTFPIPIADERGK